MMGLKQLTSVLVCLFLGLGAFRVTSRPQTQLKWNWEEVILSRNGPSTTTTPRPTRWTTTTLRFLDVAPVVQSGSVGTVENAYLVPRRREAPRDPNSGQGRPRISNLMLLNIFIGLLSVKLFV